MTTLSKLWYLENINFLDGMSNQLKLDVEQHTLVQTVKKNDFIYFTEKSPSSVYFLKKGRIKIGRYAVDGKEIVTRVLHPGEIFGELLITDNHKKQEFTQAIDDEVQIYSMEINDMKDVMRKNNKLQFGVMKWMGFRFTKLERKIESLIFKDARTRVVDLLHTLASEYGKKDGNRIFIKHHLTNKEIAKLTATSSQRVANIMKRLQNEHKIHVDSKVIVVYNINDLK